MAIYKVQGPNGEIITIEGPDGADPNDVIAQAQSLYKPKEKKATDYAKDFGKATASLADTGINAITGMLDYGAYNLARAAGLSPEKATQETTSPKDVIGRALGITEDPAYQSELSRRITGGIGEGVEKYAVKPLASATGLPEQDVSSMLGSAGIAAGVKTQPYVNRVGQKVAQGMYAAEPYIAGAAKSAVNAVPQFGKGLVEGLINKEYNPATSAMIPLRETYTPTPAAQRFMGQLPGVPEQTLSQLESQARPTSELVGGRVGQALQAISPKTLAGETLVPLQGQGFQAFGERVGRGVRTNPLQAMGEVGLTALTGIPFKTLGQGVGELGARYLGAKTGFMPGFSEKVGQAQGRAGIQGQMPQTPLLTNNPSAPGPVNPSTMYVAPEGVAGTNINQVSQAGAMAKYPPQPVQQTPQQMAIQKTQEIVNKQALAVDPAMLAKQQAMQEQIRQRALQQQQQSWQQRAGVTLPTNEAPVTPVTPTSLEQQRANLQANPPEAPVITPEDIAQQQSMAKASQASTTSDIIKQHINGNNVGPTVSIDTSKNAYNGSNSTQGKAKQLEKAGVDSLPVISGMSDAQIIDALHTEIFGKSTRNTPSIEKIEKEQKTSNQIRDEIAKLDGESDRLYNESVHEKGAFTRQELKSKRDRIAEIYPEIQKLEKELEIAEKAEKKARRNQSRGKPNVLEMKIGETGSKDFMTPKVDDTGTNIYGSKDNPLTPDQYEKVKGWKILQGNDDPHIIYSKDKNGVLKTEKIVPDEDGDLITKVRVGTPDNPLQGSVKQTYDDFLETHSDNIFSSDLTIWSKNKDGKIQNDRWEMDKATEVYDDYAKNQNTYTSYRKYEFQDREGEYVWQKDRIVNGQTVETTIYTPEGNHSGKKLSGHDSKKYRTDEDAYPDWKPSNINEWPDIFK
jgi:hypothetical protein